METQEAESSFLIGQGPPEDGGEEHVEELGRLAARDEDDDFVVLRKLSGDIISRRSSQPIRSQQSQSRKRVFTLHLPSMNAARHTSLTLLGTTTTNCFRASGTAKLSTCLLLLCSGEQEAGSERAGPDTAMLTESLRQTSASRVTPGTHRRQSQSSHI